MSAFADHFTRHAGVVFARQLAFADFLGEHEWQVEVVPGRIDFGDGRTYPIQLLGTEARETETWLWAWANEESDLPPEVLRAAETVRQFGEQQGIDLLTEAGFSLESADGHALAMLAAGVIGRTCYYRAPYGGGALFVLVEQLPDELFGRFPPERLVTVLQEVVSQFELDHREMARCLLVEQEFQCDEDERSLAARRDDGELHLTFDELGRLAEIKGQLG